ncbi:MAG: hypothetical protein CL578_00380 [Alteromonadaceae bacterium]|nr:hypothetical protein [Alteromonadaceae bacterium]
MILEGEYEQQRTDEPIKPRVERTLFCLVLALPYNLSNNRATAILPSLLANRYVARQSVNKIIYTQR